jgi:hypothetical protein
VILIQIPDNYQAERYYILSVMFQEFLGLEIQIQVSERCNVLITMGDDRELIVPDQLFSTPVKDWLQTSSLPKQPLKIWDLATTKLNVTTVNPQIPVIYGDDPSNPKFFQQSEQKIYLGIDIFGSAFFMLTCYEQCVKPNRDCHDRFPATASLAYQSGFLDRPIINEYLEILWECLKYLFPQLQRKHQEFQLKLTHDVDNPFELYPFSAKQSLRRLGGDLLVRRDLNAATTLAINVCKASLKLPYHDRLDTFDWLMDRSEQIGVKSAFYFIAGQSQSDPRYDINDAKICDLIEKIVSRGHEVGLHPGYDTYLNPDKLLLEANTLRQILQAQLKLELPIGGRQHYLRWKAPDTWQHWEDAGLAYDSSVGFAEHSGFRLGICYEYSTFNLIESRPLKLKEYPLIVMEGSILSPNYMHLNFDEAHTTIVKLKKYCELFNGVFTLLWHNSELFQDSYNILYEGTIL